MKLRHYLLIGFTVIAIAFFQPLILLLGGVTLIVGVAALIYADLSPEAQDACEHKIIQLLDQTRSFLRRNPRAATPQAVNANYKAPQHLLAEQVHADGAKINLQSKTDKTKNHQEKSAGKLYGAANPDL